MLSKRIAHDKIIHFSDHNEDKNLETINIILKYKR